MEEHATLSEKPEDQFKALEWFQEEGKRIKRELGEQLGKEISEEVRKYWMNKKGK